MADPRGQLRVTRPGLATLQDLGRRGSEWYGISTGGAADQFSAKAANLLVGNDIGAVLCEILLLDVELVAEHDALIALTGADCEVGVDGVRRPGWEPIVVRPGQRITVGAIRGGARAYLAVNGGFIAEKFTGSAAPDPVVGFGSRLAAGEALTFRRSFAGFIHPFFALPLFRLAPERPPQPDEWTVPITVAPETTEMSAPELLTRTAFEVSPVSNEVGLRLTGPPIRRTTDREIVSRGVPVGAIELTPSGELIVLMRGRFVTAGYPIVAVVTTAAQSLLGQAATGRRLRFAWQTRQDALADCRRQQGILDRLAARTKTAFSTAGLGHLLPVRRRQALLDRDIH